MNFKKRLAALFFAVSVVFCTYTSITPNIFAGGTEVRQLTHSSHDKGGQYRASKSGKSKTYNVRVSSSGKTKYYEIRCGSDIVARNVTESQIEGRITAHFEAN